MFFRAHLLILDINIHINVTREHEGACQCALRKDMTVPRFGPSTATWIFVMGGTSRDSDTPTMLDCTVYYDTQEGSSRGKKAEAVGRISLCRGLMRSEAKTVRFAASDPKSLQKGRFPSFLSSCTFLYLINNIHANRGARSAKMERSDFVPKSCHLKRSEKLPQSV